MSRSESPRFSLKVSIRFSASFPRWRLFVHHSSSRQPMQKSQIHMRASVSPCLP